MIEQEENCLFLNMFTPHGAPYVSNMIHMIITTIVFITPRAHARSGVKQWVLSVSVSVSHQNFGLITTTKGLNTSKRHSNNDNSEKTVHGVPEGG